MEIELQAAADTMSRMVRSVIATLPELAVAGVVFLAFWFAARALGNAVSALADRTRQPPSVGLVLGRLTRWLTVSLGLLVAMTVVMPSLNAASIISALGVGGVAIGFAFKDIFQNLLAGLLILITRPFSIGDQIVTGNHEGTVEDIQVRATLLCTYDNRIVVIPNSELYTNRVVVNTLKNQRRGEVTVSLGADEDMGRIKARILRELATLDPIEQDPAPSVVATGLDANNVSLSVRFWVGRPRRADMVGATDAVLTRLKAALADERAKHSQPTVQEQVPAPAATRPDPVEVGTLPEPGTRRDSLPAGVGASAGNDGSPR